MTYALPCAAFQESFRGFTETIFENRDRRLAGRNEK